MPRGRPVGSGTTLGVPGCTEHPDSRVTLKGKHRGRQRFLCTPATGASAHKFTGALAHLVADDEARCTNCDSPLARHQGPALARRYEFPVGEVALALQRVGRLMSYTEAAQRCRARTERGGKVSAQLVGNWVEVFGPVVAARHAIHTWPETVVLDSTPFSATTPTGFREVFHVLCAWGYDEGATDGRCVALMASTRRNGAAWKTMLSAKQGQPRLLVADKDEGLLAGAYQAWPEAVWRRCHWHLRQNLDRQLAAYGLHPGSSHELVTLAGDAFRGPEHWASYEQAVKRHGGVNLLSWVHDAAGDLAGEFAAATLPRHYSNGAAEKVLNAIKGPIARRAFCYRNAQRTNRLLELVRLAQNRQDDLDLYAHDIRRHLSEGGNLGHQLEIRDPHGKPSLRS